MTVLLALAIGFVLDLLLGDPRWLPHPVVYMGKLISALEKGLRAVFPKTARGEFWGGVVLAAVLPAVSFILAFFLLKLAGMVHPLLRLALESLWCAQCLASRSLRDESMKVYDALAAHDLPLGRKMVSYIVGRDTDALTEEGVTKAAVETVAENTADGVIAPMLFLAIGGAPLGLAYKAVNTMDSMVGYKNDRYLHFGTAAARLDDACNFLPARLAGLLMVLAAPLAGLSAAGALRIFRRDRRNHKSPNSAHTEAACAGALGVQLAGNAHYFGKLVEKPTIGDPLRPVEPDDIKRACRLMFASSALCFLLCEGVRALFLFV